MPSLLLSHRLSAVSVVTVESGQQDAAHEGNEPSSATGSLRTSVYPWAACPGLERVGPRRRRPRTGTHTIM
jgi:hypothetical protein